jgi:hypothetical protein
MQFAVDQLVVIGPRPLSTTAIVAFIPALLAVIDVDGEMRREDRLAIVSLAHERASILSCLISIIIRRRIPGGRFFLNCHPILNEVSVFLSLRRADQDDNESHIMVRSAFVIILDIPSHAEQGSMHVLSAVELTKKMPKNYFCS